MKKTAENELKKKTWSDKKERNRKFHTEEEEKLNGVENAPKFSQLTIGTTTN